MDLRNDGTKSPEEHRKQNAEVKQEGTVLSDFPSGIAGHFPVCLRLAFHAFKIRADVALLSLFERCLRDKGSRDGFFCHALFQLPEGTSRKVETEQNDKRQEIPAGEYLIEFQGKDYLIEIRIVPDIIHRLIVLGNYRSRDRDDDDQSKQNESELHGGKIPIGFVH